MKFHPIAYKETQPIRGKVVVKFNAHDIEKSKFFGNILLPQTMTNAGEYVTETAEIVSVSDGVEWVKSGDKVIISYLIAYDQVNSKPKDVHKIESLDAEVTELQYQINRGKAKRSDVKMLEVRMEYLREQMRYEDTNNTYSEKNQHYLDTDEYGNEYRWCLIEDIYGIIRGKKIMPAKDWVFVDEIKDDAEKKKGKIILLTRRKENAAIKTKVKYISEQDKKEVEFKERDIIFVAPRFDFKFKVGDKREWAVPLKHILGYAISDNATA